MSKIKICGITNLEDGLNAVNLGADYIGFVFYEKSPRNVTPKKARELSSRLEGVKKVGLFVDENLEKVKSIADLVGIDVLQFHGNESPGYCRRFKDKEVWKALRIKDKESLSVIPTYDSVDAILLDAHVEGKMGGTGKTFDWELAVRAKEFGKRIVLAGGLDPSNVAEAIQKVNPYAVDVSSGVEESKGKKSYEKMKSFIDIAKIPSVLLRIIECKKVEVKELYQSGRAHEYRRIASNKPSKRRFHNAISRPGFNLIAEFKKASPSRGDIRPGAEPEEIARIYEGCGASAISVLTDSHFKGELGYLERIRREVELPLLRKDFIIDPAQIYEARVYGADAVLLIAAILDPAQIREYIDIAESLGMDCLVESHNRRELDKAIKGGARIFGINNRNLHNFKIDRKTTLELVGYIPKGNAIVTESGILTYEHVKEISHPRINAMLVGEAIMSSKLNPELNDMKNKIYELLGK
jgi:indole-3-glycerol phosphate synthase